MSKFTILREFLDYLRSHKRWWLVPVALLLVMLGILLVTAKSSPLAPFIYSLF